MHDTWPVTLTGPLGALLDGFVFFAVGPAPEEAPEPLDLVVVPFDEGDPEPEPCDVLFAPLWAEPCEGPAPDPAEVCETVEPDPLIGVLVVPFSGTSGAVPSSDEAEGESPAGCHGGGEPRTAAACMEAGGFDWT